MRDFSDLGVVQVPYIGHEGPEYLEDLGDNGRIVDLLWSLTNEDWGEQVQEIENRRDVREDLEV